MKAARCAAMALMIAVSAVPGKVPDAAAIQFPASEDVWLYTAADESLRRLTEATGPDR